MLTKMEKHSSTPSNSEWPQRPKVFPDLMTPVEAAMFLRLDQVGHNPKSACRTLNYWRGKDDLRATKFAKHIWYLKKELEKFLENKTEG
jgi:hypothetical protein